MSHPKSTGPRKHAEARVAAPVAPAALGFRAHSGWAALVALAGPVSAPAVLQRRRVELADPGIRGSVQPYHAAAEMNLKDSEAFIKRCAGSSRAMAETAVRESVEALKLEGYRVLGSCILLASGRPIPGLEAILASHPLLHTAEGVFFRQSLKEASEFHALPVIGVKERDLLTQAAGKLRMSAGELQRRASELGKSVGPPWRQDEKLSAIGAWLVLADQSSR